MKSRNHSIQQWFNDRGQILERRWIVNDDAHFKGVEKLLTAGCASRTGGPPNLMRLRGGRKQRNRELQRAFGFTGRPRRNLVQPVFVIVVELSTVAGQWRCCVESFEMKSLAYNRSEWRSSDVVKENVLNVTKTLVQRLILCTEKVPRTRDKRFDFSTQRISRFSQLSPRLERQPGLAPESHRAGIVFQVKSCLSIHDPIIASTHDSNCQPCLSPRVNLNVCKWEVAA